MKNTSLKNCGLSQKNMGMILILHQQVCFLALILAILNLLEGIGELLYVSILQVSAKPLLKLEQDFLSHGFSILVMQLNFILKDCYCMSMVSRAE